MGQQRWVVACAIGPRGQGRDRCVSVVRWGGASNCSLVERHLVPRRRTGSAVIYVACQHHRNTQRRHRGKGGRQGGGGIVLSVASWRGSRASPLAKGEGRARRRHHESQGEKRGVARV
jgi:hypothetical protein